MEPEISFNFAVFFSQRSVTILAFFEACLANISHPSNTHACMQLWVPPVRASSSFCHNPYFFHFFFRLLLFCAAFSSTGACFWLRFVHQMTEFFVIVTTSDSAAFAVGCECIVLTCVRVCDCVFAATFMSLHVVFATASPQTPTPKLTPSPTTPSSQRTAANTFNCFQH